MNKSKNKNQRIKQFVIESKLFQALNSIKVPGLRGISFLELTYIYLVGIVKGAITTRATGISYSLFMSLFPFMLLIFSILPLLPHYDILESYFFDIYLPNLLPENILKDAQDYLRNNFVVKGKGGILSSNLFLAIGTLFFATNGINALISGFKKSYLSRRKDSMLKQYIFALFITTIVLVMIFSSLIWVYYSDFIWKYMSESGTLPNYDEFLIKSVSYSVVLMASILMHCLLYSAGRTLKRLSELLPGAILSTLLSIVFLLLFKYYIVNFAIQDKLYGSVGIVLIILFWIYSNVIVNLIGYELNLAIKLGKSEKARERMITQLHSLE